MRKIWPSETIGSLLAHQFGKTESDKKELWHEYAKEVNRDVSIMWLDLELQRARINYMMRNPTTFLYVDMFYDLGGTVLRGTFPEGVNTKGKICVLVFDNMSIFSDKSGIALLDEFKRNLKVIYTYVEEVATNMDTDIVAKFGSKEKIPLGYFYQGEYYLWGK